MPGPALRSTLARPGAGVWIGVAAVLIGCVALTAASVPIGTTLLLVAVMAFQSISGGVIWLACSPGFDPVMRLGMSLAIGTALAVLVGSLTSLAGLGPWGWALPSSLALLVLLGRRVLARPPKSWDSSVAADRPVLLSMLVAGVVGLGLFAYNVRSYPLTWVGSWSGYHGDMAFFEAISTSIARWGPAESIFTPDAQIRYHWLVYGWAGQVTEAAGAAPFVSLTRLVPLVALLSASAIVVAWARRLSSVAWVPSLAAVTLILGGYLGAVYGGVLTIDSPSQSLTVAWMLAFVLACLKLLQPDSRRSLLLPLIGVLAFAMVGGKVSCAAPALAAVLLLGLVGVIRREEWRRRALLACLVAMGAAATAFLLLLWGSSGGGGLDVGSLIDRSASQQGLNPIPGPRGVIAGTVILLVAISARWAGLAWLVADRGSRWQPSTVIALGLAASSLAAVAAFSSSNELWFATAASAPLSAVSAAGAGQAVRALAGRDRRREQFITLAAVGLGALVFLVVGRLWLTGASGGNVWVGTWRWTAPFAGGMVALIGGLLLARRSALRPVLLAALAGACAILVVATAPGRLLGVGTGLVGTQENGIRNEWFSRGDNSVRGRDQTVPIEWTSSQMAAAAWLRQRAGPDDLVATNRSLGAFVPGVTGLPNFASAIQYQVDYGRPWVREVILQREAQSWTFIDAPSAQSVLPLCEAGVWWLWVDPTLTQTTSWAPYAEVAHRAEDVVILRLGSSTC